MSGKGGVCGKGANQKIVSRQVSRVWGASPLEDAKGCPADSEGYINASTAVSSLCQASVRTNTSEKAFALLGFRGLADSSGCWFTVWGVKVWVLVGKGKEGSVGKVCLCEPRTLFGTDTKLASQHRLQRPLGKPRLGANDEGRLRQSDLCTQSPPASTEPDVAGASGCELGCVQGDTSQV